MSTIVARWFGDRFSDLHPMLQDLHLRGGKLKGEVKLEYSKGLAGFFGRSLASKIGLPNMSGIYQFEVVITHDDEHLNWTRKFNGEQTMKSIFAPHGFYPEGFWSEKTGATELFLGVEIINGGWHWKQRKIILWGKSFPRWFLPSAIAYKSIKNGMYEFSVSLTFPLLGQFVNYSGLLNAVENA